MVLNGVTYEPFGAVNGWSWGNGTTTVRGFNNDGNISAISSASAKTYAYDNASRITAIGDTGNAALSWNYGYDLLDRVTSAATSTQSVAFSYDANDNRLTQSGTTSATYTLAAGSNLLGGVGGGLTRSYIYDARGNTLSSGAFSVGYDAAGRVVSASSGLGSATYVYNSFGQRIQKTTPNGTTIFVYE